MTATKISVAIWTVAAIAGVATLVQPQRAATRLEASIAADRGALSSMTKLQAENRRLQQALRRAQDLKADADSLAKLQATDEALKKTLAKRTPAPRPATAEAVKTVFSKVYDPNQLDVQPAPTWQGHPSYPADMRAAGIGGKVTVDFVVDEKGAVKNAFAASSSRPEFESAAVAAVSGWTFTPGQVGGSSVPAHVQVPMVFSLQTKTSPGDFVPSSWFTPSNAH